MISQYLFFFSLNELPSNPLHFTCFQPVPPIDPYTVTASPLCGHPIYRRISQHPVDKTLKTRHFTLLDIELACLGRLSSSHIPRRLSSLRKTGVWIRRKSGLHSCRQIKEEFFPLFLLFRHCAGRLTISPMISPNLSKREPLPGI